MRNNGETSMKTLGVRELTERITDILRMVEEEGETFEVTNHGVVIARLVPARSSQPSIEQEAEDAWANLDKLAAEIGSHLPDKVNSIDIIHDVRRDL
jgi:prevent-host-death family protein